MTHDTGILHACTITGQGPEKILIGQDISNAIKDDMLAWVHLDGNDDSTRAWLNREISYLDSLIIDALLAEETRPRLLEFDKGALLILRGVNLNDNAQPEDMISIRLWVDEHRIISIQRRPLKATRDMYDRLLAGTGPTDAGDFVVNLMYRLFERMEPVFSDLDDQLDGIEQRVVDNPDISERRDIANIRKQAIIFRRYISPQKDVVSYLRQSEQSWISAKDKRHLQEVSDRIFRYTEGLDTIRERAQVIKDDLANTLADQMNKNMYMLSVIAAIFLPLGFLTGLLGINVGGIPGADQENAFIIFCVILLAIIAAQIAAFKKLKWF